MIYSRPTGDRNAQPSLKQIII